MEEIMNNICNTRYFFGLMELMAFSGQISAGYTHEIKNILGTIEQAAGLMSDICSLLSDEIPDKYSDRLESAVFTIEEQIQRGVSITEALNRFSHSSDNIKYTININNNINFMVKLCARFANMEEIALRFSDNNRIDEIFTIPVFFNYILYNSILASLDAISQAKEIIIKTYKNSDHVNIHIVINEKSEMTKIKNIEKSDYWKNIEKFSEFISARPCIDVEIPGINIEFPLKFE